MKKMHLGMIQCDTIGMWLGANCCTYTQIYLQLYLLQCRDSTKNKIKKMTTTTTAMKPPHSYEACGFVSSYLIDITYGTCMAVVVIHSAYFIVFITFCIQKLSIEAEAFSAFYTYTYSKCKTKYKSNVFVKAK